MLGWIVVALDLGLVGSLAAHYLWSNEILPLHPALFVALVALLLVGIGCLAYTWGRDRSFVAAVKETLESEARLLTSQLQAAVWTTDTELRQTSASGALLARLEAPELRVPGATLYEVFGTHDVGHPVIAAHLQALRGESVTYHRAVGPMIVEGRIEPLRDGYGAVTGSVGFAVDVTARERAAEELRESEALLSAVGEMARVGGWELDVATREVRWTQETYAIHEVPVGQEIHLADAILFFDLPDRAALESALRRCMEDGEPFDLELPFTSAKGTHLWAHAVGRAVRVDGAIAKLAGTFQDITERKLAEETRREAEEHFRVLAENSPDLVARFDTRLRHLYVNPAAAAAGKLSASEYVGLTIAESGVAEPFATTRTQRLEQVLKTGTMLEVEDVFPTPEGVRHFHTRIVPELAPDGSIRSLLSFARDVTERKRTEREMARLASFPQLSPMPVVEVDAAGKISFMNPVAGRLFPELRAASPDHPFVAAAWNLIAEPQGEGKVSLSREVRVGDRWYIQNLFVLPDHSHVRIYASDITDRKRAEDVSRRYQALVESSDDAVIGLSLDEVVESWNAGAERLYGYRAEEVTGRPFSILVPPEGQNELRIILELVRKGHRVESYETERMRKDGRLVPVSVTASPIMDRAGRVVGISGIHRDISVRKRADEAIRRLAAIVESSDDAILSTDVGRVIRTWNAGAERLYGYTAAEALGKNIDSLVLAPGAQADVDAVAERLARGAAAVRYEGTRVRKDGSLVEIAGTASEIRDASGALTGYSVIVRDIAERKRTEEALRESEASFRLLTENATDIISRHAPDGTFLYVSPACRKLLGYDAAELVGRSPYEFIHPHDATVTTPPGELFDLRKSYSVTFRFRRKDGTYGWFESFGHTEHDQTTGAVTEIHAMSRDVTDRMQVQLQLRKQGEELRALARHLESVRDDEHAEMVRVIHDELGQALTALRLDLSWLGRRLPARSTALRRKLDEMAALTDGTIEASRRLVADLRPPILDDLGLVPALEWYLKHVEERTKVRARLDVDAEPLDVTGPVALTAYRIVQEALTNVARHAEAKHVTVRLGTQAGALLLEITDDGAGIRADTADSPRSFGIMGMRERALAHGGALEVGPSPGGGTVVRATIPLGWRQAARGPA